MQSITFEILLNAYDVLKDNNQKDKTVAEQKIDETKKYVISDDYEKGKYIDIKA